MATLADYYGRVGRSLAEDIERYNITDFVETGTGLGDTVSYVLSNSGKLIKVWSIEIYEDIAKKAADRFSMYNTCDIINKSSLDGLHEILPQLGKRAMFFLDAHFPGADFGYTEYGAAMEHEVKLPLEAELKLLYKNRDLSQDIILIDDLRIYEEGYYEMGNWQKKDGATHSGTDFVTECLAKTHVIQKHSFFSGFITALPYKQSGL